jgi:TatD DNase family protein
LDIVYTFGDPSTLYLNVTNRCTNRCVFCVRNGADRLGSGVLRGGPEPDLEVLRVAVEERLEGQDVTEIVWCGFGEPTWRIDLITAMAPALQSFRAGGGRVRLNTNGQGSAIHGRDLWPELAPAIDVVSVSLNAPTKERYLELCAPDPRGTAVAEAGELYAAMLDFLRDAPRWVSEVRASVVAYLLDDDEISSCQELLRELGGGELLLR